MNKKKSSIKPLTPTPRQVVKYMYERDECVKLLGIKIKKISQGYCKLEMKVTENMLNSHQICHGGFIFTLADTAFAYASNSSNQAAVAYNCNITFLAPGELGKVYFAEAKEVIIKGRSSVYDIEISDKKNIIALFRGNARFINKNVID